MVRRGCGNQPSGGTSVEGLLACNQVVKLRTTLSRMASHDGDASAGALIHALANSLVIWSTPDRSKKARNCLRSNSSRTNLNPSARRTPK